jgi:hypothetical protein
MVPIPFLNPRNFTKFTSLQTFDCSRPCITACRLQGVCLRARVQAPRLDHPLLDLEHAVELERCIPTCCRDDVLEQEN